MNAARYKLMLSYLPGMAAIVNSFQSSEVQVSVYESLMEALNVRMDAEAPGAGQGSSSRKRTAAAEAPATRTPTVTFTTGPADSGVFATDVAHDLEDGDSIHNLMEQHATLP